MSRRIVSICFILAILLVAICVPALSKVNAQVAPTTTPLPLPSTTVTSIPGADFSGAPLTGNAPLTVQFTALNSSVLMSCTWTFGDGATQTFTPAAGYNLSKCPSTSHIYTLPGSFNVKLSVTKISGISNSMTKTNYVQVSGSTIATSTPTPNASLPDLVISSITYEGVSGTGCAAHPVDRVWIANIGSVDVNTGFIVSITADGVVFPAQNGGLAAGASTSIGVYAATNVSATIDSTGVIDESNESNNSLSVVLPAPPTLVPTCTPYVELTITKTRTFTPVVSLTPTLTRTITLSPTRTPTGPTPTLTRTPTAGLTFTRTPTFTATAGFCAPTATITAPFTQDGAGAFCWQSTNLGAYINSWNMTSLTINGLNYTNLYLASGSYPAKLGGYWYVSYASTSASGHFEAK